MVRYACFVSMTQFGFGFSIICDVDAPDMPAATALIAQKMHNAKHDHPNLEFREVKILAPTPVEKATDANHD
jgi:hypothetical protein